MIKFGQGEKMKLYDLTHFYGKLRGYVLKISPFYSGFNLMVGIGVFSDKSNTKQKVIIKNLTYYAENDIVAKEVWKNTSINDFVEADFSINENGNLFCNELKIIKTHEQSDIMKTIREIEWENNK